VGALPLTAAISCASNMGYGIEWEQFRDLKKIQSDPATLLFAEGGDFPDQLVSSSCSRRE